jgi:MFS family permease
MGVFRLIADQFVAKYGRLFVVRVGGFLAAIGIAGAISVSSVPVSTGFWFIAGLGISSVVPQLFAYSATIGEESHSGRNLAKVFGITYAGMLGGPAVIGWLTTMFSLGQALSVGVALGIVIAVGALFMPNQRADKNW